MTTDIWPTLAFPAPTKWCVVPPSYPGSPDPCMPVQWNPGGLWALPVKQVCTHIMSTCTHSISTVSTPAWAARPLKCWRRIFTMYNAHITKRWRPWTDFHTFASTEKKSSQTTSNKEIGATKSKSRQRVCSTIRKRKHIECKEASMKKVRGSVAGAPLLVPGVPGRSIVPHLHIIVLWLVLLQLVHVLG